jgi:hypothetical protein
VGSLARLAGLVTAPERRRWTANESYLPEESEVKTAKAANAIPLRPSRPSGGPGGHGPTLATAPVLPNASVKTLPRPSNGHLAEDASDPISWEALIGPDR